MVTNKCEEQMSWRKRINLIPLQNKDEIKYVRPQAALRMVLNTVLKNYFVFSPSSNLVLLKQVAESVVKCVDFRTKKLFSNTSAWIMMIFEWKGFC